MKRLSNTILLALVAVIALFSFASCATAQVPAPEEPVFVVQSYDGDIYGNTFTLELVAPDKVEITYPDFITSDELDAFVKQYAKDNAKVGKLSISGSKATLALSADCEDFEKLAKDFIDYATKYINAEVEALETAENALLADKAAKAAAEAEAAAKAAAEAAARVAAARTAEEKAAAEKAAAEAAAKAAALKAEADKAAAEKAAAEAAAKAEADAAAKAEADAAAAAKEALARGAEGQAAAEAAAKAAKRTLTGVVILIIVICGAAAAAVYYFLVWKKKEEK